ncbi:hypothetical protein JIQ42_05025 [Leishmania sp. Namibia]|uniref:hypothetical protein n=1 Tax=Leishmania sp. Namibia TaxID=2802991 RepID=UPI001B6A2AF2|nr:hypothetical protein JIQ42_05025 [Leishmania sp. Namibia]
MHAPRCGQALSHLRGAPASNTSSSPSGTSARLSCLGTQQQHPRPPRQLHASAGKHDRDNVPPSIAPIAPPRRQTASTASVWPPSTSPRQRVSPRALWRARAPRRLPAAAVSLLPRIPSATSLTLSTSSRTERPLGGVRSVSPGSSSRTAAAADGGSSYDGEYDRLVFSPIHPRRTAPAAASSAGLEDRNSDAGNTVAPGLSLHSPGHHYAESPRLRGPRGLLSRGFITASQAAAALERLPELSTSQRRQAAFLAISDPISGRATATSTSSSLSCRPCCRTTAAARADTPAPQPAAWWSTLDGTLSANNTLFGDESQQLCRKKKTPPPGPSHSFFAPSLNDTLGRAGRAAMVLSMQLSGHTSSAAGEAVATAVVRAKVGDPDRGGSITGRTAKGGDTTITAVAALAKRLTRAAEGGSLGGCFSGAGSTMLSNPSRRSVGQDTLQDLRDTLRLTKSPSEKLDVTAPGLALHWLDASEGDCGPRSPSVRRSKPGPRRATDASRAHWQATEDAAHPHRAEGGGTEAIKGGGGTQRIRDALVRLYAKDAVVAPAPAAPLPSSPLPGGGAGGLAGEAVRGPRSASTATDIGFDGIRRPSSGFTTDPNAVAREGAGTDADKRDDRTSAASGALPSSPHRHAAAESPMALLWPRGSLTVEELERRYGAPSAIHTLQKRRRSHDSRCSGGRPSVDHAPHGSHAETLALSTSPVASSIPTSDFTAASLTSSIFARELGEGEAARSMFSKNLCKLVVRREAVRSASGAAARRSPSTSRHSTSATKVSLPHDSTMRRAAAEAHRQKQLQLYASHLSTPSTLPTNDESVAAERGLLDVESLFQDTKRDTAGRNANHVRFAGEPGTGAPSATIRGGGGGASAGARDAAATTRKRTASEPAALTSPSLSALDRALRTRAALLRRHAQEGSAWKQRLHRVRQWCDRTQVMVRFGNGVCVEQTAAGPLHRTATQQRQRQYQVQATGAGLRTDSEDVPMGAGTSAAKLYDGAAWQHFVYADDPVAAHDTVMQQLAEEEREVRRQNALQRCRERRQGPMLAEWPIGSSYARPLAPPEKSGGSGQAVTQATSSGSFDHHAEDRRSTRALPSSNPDAVWGLLRVMSPLTGLGTKPALLQVHRHSSQLSMSATDEVTAKRTSVMLLSRASSLSIQPPRGPTHADLCVRLQTWGAEVEEDEEALAGGGSSTADISALPSAAVGAGRDGGVVSLERRAAPRDSVRLRRCSTLLSNRFEGSLCSESAEGLRGEPRGSAQREPALLDGASSLAPLQSSSPRESVTAALTKVERDLLSFVLTCASGGGGVEHLSTFSLRYSRRSDSSAIGAALDGAAAVAGGRVATKEQQQQPALVALRMLLERCSHTPTGDGAAADANSAQETAICGAAEARAMHGSVWASSPLPNPSGLEEVAIAQETAGVSSGAGADAGLWNVDHESGKPGNTAATTLPTERGSAVAPAREIAVLPWSVLVTSLLGGYSALDLSFLRQLHLLLWQYESQEHESVDATAVEPATGVAAPGVLTSPPPASTPCRSQGAPPAVLPLLLHLHAAQEASMAASVSFQCSDSGVRTSFTVSVDAADLLNTIEATALLRWLCDFSRQSPTSSWAELVERAPATCAQDWKNALARCIKAASRGIRLSRSSWSHASLPSGESWRSHALLHTGPDGAAVPAPYPPQLESFVCDTASALESAVWRLRRVHDVLHCASLRAERDQNTWKSAAAADATAETLLAAGNTSVAVAAPFPCVGETPYLPGDGARARYPLDMRSLYLLSALAAEDVDAHVVPQLREARAQYAGALQAATAAPTIVGVPFSSSLANEPLLGSKSTASLPVALEQHVRLHRLCLIEERFFSLLSALWTSEQSIRAFNQHVSPFNAFTAAELSCWGPLYCSSLKVAYFVCEELADKGMENLSTELLPFVSVVASFAGCCGGHRELLSKLKTVMLELTERAKKVQVPLESLSWQKKRPQVLAEAIAASKIASRRAAAVVSCLTSEADVVSLPLTELAMPKLRLIHVLPLPPPRDNS